MGGGCRLGSLRRRYRPSCARGPQRCIVTRAEIVAAMLAVIPPRVTPEQVAGFQGWERRRICRQAGCDGCSPEAWNELVYAVWARGAYHQKSSSGSSDPFTRA